MTNLLYFVKDTVIIPALNGWGPLPRVEAYKKLLDKDQNTLRMYLETQHRYLNNNPTPIEKKKLIEGLKLIEEILQGKSNV